MGLIGEVLSILFGGSRNVVRETAELFLDNTEAAAERDAEFRKAVLAQFAAEFANPRQSLFDRLIDAVNRLPRPALALGTIGMFVAAMIDPIWFAARMQGIALVPEPLWWLLGAIISFYFGARHQAKGQEFQRSIAATVAQAPAVTGNIRALRALQRGAGGARDDQSGPNPALDDWKRQQSDG